MAYLGTRFHGFVEQPGQRTVAGELLAALARQLRHPVRLTCAGRTDAGVHARGQVVSLDARADADPGRLAHHLNRSLGPEIAVREAAWAPEGFDARRWATARRYRYAVLAGAVPDPLRAATTWHVREPLDLPAMRLAADPLVGEHDFASFCRAAGGASLVREVREAVWADLGEGRLRFEIEASAFCQQMVRAVVGTLVEVGRGRRRAGEVAAVLRARDRAAAGALAPPHGLCLWEVRYGPGPATEVRAP